MVNRTIHLGKTPLASAYTGPGDIQSGALFWYGLRAYNAAYATGSNAAIDITDTSDANPATINILSTGALDEATLNTWIVAHGTAVVKKFYDQSGHGLHVTQSIVAQRPPIVQNGIGSHSVIACDENAGSGAGQVLYDFAASPTLTQPIHTTSVAWRITGAGNVISLCALQQFISTLGADTAIFPSGDVGTFFSATAADGAPHSFVSVLNAASSAAFVDGTLTTGSNNSSGLASGVDIKIGGASVSAITIRMAETGIWGGTVWGTSAGQTARLMDANQRAYWGL